MNYDFTVIMAGSLTPLSQSIFTIKRLDKEKINFKVSIKNKIKIK